MPEPWSLSIAEAATQLQRKELSAVQLTRSLLDRIDSLEPHLHAWVTIDREGLLNSAAQADKDLKTSGPRGPLHGVPIALKDIFYTAGMKTTACSPILADFVPTYDATVVARLKKAGALVLGKAVTTQFATSDPSPTINPWNPAHSPGGSSSGSAVAVASFMGAGALGSQTGGSTCRPASYNGIVGLKPTFGRLSRYGVIPVSWSLDTVGILTRTVEDAAIMLDAMAGHDSHDPWSSKEPAGQYRVAVKKAAAAPRLRLVRQFFMERCDDEVRAHTQQMAQSLADAGAGLDETGLPDSFTTCLAAHRVVMDVECATVHEGWFRQFPEKYGPNLRRNIELGSLVPGVRYMQAQRLRSAFARDMRELVAGGDILLTPTTPTPAPRSRNTTGDPMFQSPWTSCGLPTVTIPSGLSASGLPLGLQLVGAPFREDLLLAAARWCEQALGMSLNPPDQN